MLTWSRGKSDTPRGAGGLMSWTASKAVGHWFRRRAQARLCQQFRTSRLLHPRCLVREHPTLDPPSLVINPREEDLTPGTVKPAQVSLFEPVTSQFQLIP